MFSTVAQRFNEWGQACWSLQKSQLSGVAGSFDWRFQGFFLVEEDCSTLAACRRLEGGMRGKVLNVARLCFILTIFLHSLCFAWCTVNMSI